MKKILLSTIALMMSVAMMAVGLGDGSSQSNAIDFDWDGTYIHEANNTSWHCIKLSKLSEEADDPTVALYLTNLTNERANVELSGSAVLRFPYPISLFVKDIDLLQYAGDDANATYEIEGKKHVVWTMPTSYDLSSISDAKVRDALAQAFGDISNVSLLQLVEFGLNDVYLEVSSDKQIAIAANVYETAEIVDDACTKAVDFEWSGETVEAGETWFYLDLNEVKNSDKKLNFVVENNGTVDAIVAFDLYADCPASAILLDYDWTIPAGAEVKEALGRFFLDQMTRDYVYLKLTTDQSVTLKAEEEVLPPPVELFNPSAAPVLEVGKEYVLNGGETVLKVDLAALKAPKGYKTVCHIVNPNDAAVNLKQEIAFATPVTSNNVQEKNLLVAAGAELEINIPNKQIESVNTDVAYFRLTTDETLNLVIERVKLETSKPVDPSAPSTPVILAPTCEDSYAFDWNSSVKQKALMTKWYELDITSLKKNEEHVQLSFINHTESVVLVMGSILLDCNATDTIPFICPVPAGKPISKVIDYSLLAASPIGKAYVSLTMVPTSAKSLAEFASVRSQADLMNMISLDFAGEIEVKAKRISALVDPSYCEATYQTLEKGVEYHLEPGKTQWYRVTGDFLEDLGLLEKLTIINNGKQDANVTFGATADCKYGIATTITQTVPTWFDLTSYYPSGLYQLASALTDKEISEFYLSVKADQPMVFGFGLNLGTMLGCDDAIVFDWEKGAVINSRDAQWYNFDLNTVKASGSHLKLTFTNHSDEIVWVASMASLTCPLKVVMPTIVPVLPGRSVDKVIDYSFVATNPINNVYVAVITEGKIELSATLIDATVEEPVDCVNHVEVKSGEKYTHKPGTTWYKFSNDLLADMGRAPRFTFENLSSNAISFSAGMTVDCKYGILTKVNAKIPAHVLGQHLHNREFSVRIPRLFFQAVRKLIDSDVTELLFQLTADNPFAFSIDMQSNDECGDAQDLLLEGCYDLKANEDKWFKLDVHAIDTLSESLNLTIYKDTDADLYLEAEASPVCPMMLSITEKRTIAFEDSVGMTLSPELLKEKLQEYSKYIGEDMSCYIRLKSNCDLTICVNTVRPPVPDTCENVEELNWTDAISLKSLENKLYRLDVASLHTLSEASKRRGIRLIINNDVEAGATLITEVYADCMDEAPITGSYSEVVFNELGDTTLRVPYAKFESLGLAPEQTEMYLKVIDIVPPTCDKVMPTQYESICVGDKFPWRGQEITTEGYHYAYDTLECGVVTYTLKLEVKNCDEPCLDAELVSWKDPFFFEANTDKWYKVDVAGVVDAGRDLKFTVFNRDQAQTIFIGYALECPYNEEDLTSIKSEFGANEFKHYTVSAQKLQTTGAYDYVYVHVVTVGEAIAYAYPTTSCAEADKINWYDPIRLEGKMNKWYKMDLTDAILANVDVPVTIINGDAENTIVIEYATDCPYEEEDLARVPAKDLAANDTLSRVITAQELATSGAYELYVHVVAKGAIGVEPDIEPCMYAEPLKVECGTSIRLEANTDKWYKLDVATIADLEDDVRLVIENGAEDNTITVEYGVECPTDPWTTTKPYTILANAKDTAIITQNDLDMAGAIDYVYVHITTTSELTATVLCACYEYATITGSVCDGDIYEDPITGKEHVISSLIAASQTWNDTVITDLACDSIYTFVITPTVAPQVMTEDLLATIPGALPTLNPGCTVDVAGTIEAIKAYYDVNDTEAIADVVNVEWTAGADAKLDCNATKHTMTLKVEAGCKFVINTTINLTVEPINVDDAGTTDAEVCEGESYEWPVNGVIYTPTKDTTVVEVKKNECGCEFEKYTLNLTIKTRPAGDVTVRTLCYEDEYEWNGVTYSIANGNVVVGANADVVYPTEAACDVQVDTLRLTVLAQRPAGDVTVRTLCYEDEYEWNGVTYSIANGNVVVGANADIVYPTEAACDVQVDTLRLTVLAQRPAGDVIVRTLCYEDEYEWNGVTYSIANGNVVVGANADVVYPTEAACDVQVDTLRLTVLAQRPAGDVTVRTLCYEDEYEWNGVTYSIANGNVVVGANADIVYPTEAACDVQVDTLRLTVLAQRPAGDVIVRTLCYEDEYEWNGVTYSIANGNVVVGANADIVYPTEAACDVQVDTLRLTVLAQRPVGDVTVRTLCYEDEYEWNGVTYSIANGNVVVGANADIVYPTEAACDVQVDTLRLTVLAQRPAGDVIVRTLCYEDEYEWNGVTYSIANGNVVVGANADVVYPTEAACDVQVDTLRLTVLAEVEDVVEYDTICPGETITWNGVTFATAGEHTLTLQNENGCDYQATLHLHIPDPENYVAYDQIPAVSKYGGRMMVINLNAIDSIFGWTPAEGDVQWFKVVGEVDNAFDALNRLGDPAELDELLHTGYYHNAFDGSVMPDSYYALIVHEMVSGECQEIMRTTVLSSGAASETPKLVPTIAEPSEQLRILNLNPSNVTEVRVFNTSGELIENYTASEASEFVFKAATMQGYYMVEVQSENDKVTLRYIVK